MGIHFISGKPGGGKSLYATKLVFEELRFGARHIVTNLALNVGELNAYYQEHFDDPVALHRFHVPRGLGWLFMSLPDWLTMKVFPVSPAAAEEWLKRPRLDDICSRITIIAEEDLPVFFTKRPYCEIEHIDNVRWKAGARPDYSKVNDAGVFFVLDEVHIAFNSRAWAETGAEVLYYLSQHRKLGDDVICVTQSVANVDKQFRSVAQDFTYVRNLGKEMHGKFRLPARFVRKTYSQPPTGSTAVEPMDIGFFSLDIKGIARCYDTAKGVGIHGRSGADTRQRPKGIHWAWFAVGLPVLLFLIIRYVPSGVVHLLNRNAPPRKTAAVAVAVPNSPVPSPVVSSVISVPNTNLTSVASTLPTEPAKPPVVCVGWCRVGSNYLAFTSDGETYESQYHELDWIQRRRISILGKVYDIVTRPASCEAQTNLPAPMVMPASAPMANPENPVQVTVIGQRRQLPESQTPSLAKQLGSAQQIPARLRK